MAAASLGLNGAPRQIAQHLGEPHAPADAGGAQGVAACRMPGRAARSQLHPIWEAWRYADGATRRTPA